MMDDSVNPNRIGDDSVGATRMTTAIIPPGLAPKTAQRTSLGHRLQRALTGGPNRRFPGFHSPPGGAASLSPFLNRRLGFPILAILALLAASLLFLLPGGPLQAQDDGSGAGCEENADKTGYECEYAENGTGPVATFTATDPEGDPVLWDIVSIGDDSASVDAAVFKISKDGVLTFEKSPNYEDPTAVTDNTYVVIVRATDDAYDIAVPDGGTATSKAITKTVTVMVTNVEEPGKVKLTVATDIDGTSIQVPVLQPQMGVVLTATLSDGDDVTADTLKWKWYRGSTEIIGATEAAYTPVQADIGEKLTAKATYTDGKNSNDKDMAEATTIMAVRVAPEDNTGPEFPDQKPETTAIEQGDKDQERQVAENTPAGRNIGAPVKANDEGDVLAYSLSGDDASLFDIDIATGQLKTKGQLNRETLTDRDTDTPGRIESEVMVTAVDPFGKSDTATVTIEIENEDESPTINERTAKTMLRYSEPLFAEGATENDKAPVELWTYAATDHEDDFADPVVPLKWKLEGADRSKLVIGNTNADRGQLKFDKNPDFEKPVDANKNNVYEVTVVVTDSGRLTDRLVVRVEVTNDKETGEVTFTAATPRVGVPVTAMLEDPDGDETGHEWQWMVTPTGETATAIDGATSATFTPRSSDLGKTLSVKVKYTDGKGKDEVTQELMTPVAAPAAPLFYKAADPDADVVTKFDLELEENTEATFAPSQDKKRGNIFVGHWQDSPNITLRYAVGGTDGESFKIVTDSTQTGLRSMVQLEAQVPLDKEDKASYAVEVTATDSDGSSATLVVTVKVTNADEMPDVSSSSADCEETSDKMGYDCDYEENGTGPVATFTATDPEGDPVLWDIVSIGDDSASVDAAVFKISKDGVLTFEKSPNYEDPTAVTDNTYVVIVRATDDAYDIAVPDGGTATSKAITKTVTVMVTNVEEPGKVKLTVATDIDGTSTQVPVLQPQMGVVLTATLSDGDDVTADTLKWKWYRGSTEITDGTITNVGLSSMYEPRESDIRSGLTAKATYMDGEDANNQKMAENSRTRTVRVAPEDNTGPEFPDQKPGTPAIEQGDKDQERQVAENTPAGRNIGAPVRANDEGDVLAYSLSGDDASLFDIDITTGQLKTKGQLNRETLTDRDTDTPGRIESEVMVTAVDPFGESDTATVTIEIENEDESPTINERTAKTMLRYSEPLFAEGATENDKAPVELWTYAATDHEDDFADPVVPLKWKLEGADRSKLVIGNTNADRGQLKFDKNPDFEKPVDANKNNVYEVTVVVTDSGRLTDRLVVRVEVTNDKETGEVTFTAATPRVGVPVTAMLEDPDGDETGHEWQWMVTPTGETATAIDGATSATFTPRSSDLGKTLSVKVKYTDGKGKDEVTQELMTPVAAPAAPLFYKAADPDADVVTKFDLELEENTEATFAPSQDKKRGNIFVGHRDDAPNTILRYAVGGTDGESFKIVTDSTQTSLRSMVQLEAQVPLDKEDKASYAVEVTATDSRGSSATLAVTVKVTDADEMPVVMLGALTNQAPTFPRAAARSVAENTLAGTNIGAPVAATDADNDALTYTLGGVDEASFDIVRTTGQLQTKAALDYETKKRYSVIVSVRDSKDADGNPDTATDDTITVTITVTGVNDAPVAPTVANQTATKDTAFSFTVPAFTDPEGGTITYTATLSDDSALPGWLSFNASTRELSGTPLEADTPASLTIKVSATDGGSPSASAQVTFTLTVGEEAPTTLLVRYDGDEDGWIQLKEARVAVGHYFGPPKGVELSLDDTRKVVGLYFEYKTR